MHIQGVTTFAALAATALANPLPKSVELEERAAAAAQCTSGVVVYGVRGSSNNPTTNNDPNIYNALPGAFTQIANAAISKAGGGYLQAIAYPASDPNANGGANYGPSVAAGIASLQDTIYNYINNCPNGKIVVLGYSQGAQIVTGALAGSTSRGPLMAKGRVTAGAVFADPTYRDGREPVDQGSGANNGPGGTVPGDGTKYDNLNKWFGTRVRSYCEAGDKFCDSGADPNAAIHQRSPDVFEGAAQTFITGLV